MRIAINLLPFRFELGGAGRFARSLVHEFARLDTVNEYTLFVTPFSASHFRTGAGRFSEVICSVNPNNVLARIAWEQFVLPIQLLRSHIDILFTPSVSVPAFYTGRMYTAILDIAYQRLPDKYPPWRRAYVAAATWVAVHRSDLLCTISEFSRSEIQSSFHIGEKRIVLTRCGLDEAFLTDPAPEQKQKVAERYTLPAKFILYVGAIEPGKNLDTLLRVFGQIVEDESRDEYLVLTGGLGWRKDHLEKNISKRMFGRLKFLPFVPQEDLPALYSLASCFAYLSSYEGFGLPVLEALACGVPVVASDLPPIREFASGIALLVDPRDDKRIKESILACLDAPDIKQFFRLKAPLAARRFTYEAAATALLEAFSDDTEDDIPR